LGDEAGEIVALVGVSGSERCGARWQDSGDGKERGSALGGDSNTEGIEIRGSVLEV